MKLQRARTIEEYYVERERDAAHDVRVRVAGIPEEYRGVSWRAYKSTAMVDDEKLKDILMDYGATWEPADRMSVVVLGDQGYGKTMGMALLAQDLIEKGAWVRWIEYAELVKRKINLIKLAQRAEATDDWGDHEREEMHLRWITKNCDALFLDDIGKEHRTAGGFSDDELDHLLRTRQAAGKLTFLTSNFTEAEFATYSPSMASFLGQMAEVCEITKGEDHREAIVPPKRARRRAGR